MGSFKFIDYQKIALLTSHKQGLNSLGFSSFFNFHVSFVYFLPSFISYGDFLKTKFSLFVIFIIILYVSKVFFASTNLFCVH
jgi:hypothetical protein